MISSLIQAGLCPRLAPPHWHSAGLKQDGDGSIATEPAAQQIKTTTRASLYDPIELDEMCPAVGAGVVGVQCRSEDEGIRELLQMIDHEETHIHITAERTMLHGLQGHCNSPIAGHCHTTEDGQLSLLGMVFSRDGGEFAYSHEWDTRERAFELGGIVAATFNRKGARDIIAGIPH